MGLIRVNICCGPRLKDNHYFFKVSEALEEVIFTAEEHGLAKVPQIEIYAVEDGRNFIGEIQVNDETFEVAVRQEDPIAFIITMN